MRKLVCPIISLFLFVAFFCDAGNAVCVNVPTANLRTGPGTTYEIGWTVNQYMPLKIVGQSTTGEWYAVEDVDNTVLWIRKNLVTDKYQCAVVNVEKVNIRTGPGTNYDKLTPDPVDKYYSAKIMKKDEPWIEIIDKDSATGWIHSDYIWVQ